MSDNRLPGANPCSHWDHCDCDDCIADCDLSFSDMDGALRSSGHPGAGPTASPEGEGKGPKEASAASDPLTSL